MTTHTAPTNATPTTAPSATREPGDRMPDGTIFAGLSPETGKQMFAMPADAGVTMTFNEAAKYAKKLNAEKTFGHDDWRVPTKAELNVLFENRDKGVLKGTFNLAGSNPSGWYWADAPYIDIGAYCQRFSNGLPVFNDLRGGSSSLRCVR
jgi:hypothetical protein